MKEHRIDGWRARVLFAVAAGAVLSSAMVTADRAGWFLIPAFGAAAVAAVLALVAVARNVYVTWSTTSMATPDAPNQPGAGVVKTWLCALLGHHWTDIRNKVIESGEWCPRCGAVRAGSHTQRRRP